MADDIDIEEHDVYESLRRKQMAEVTVKTEPVDEEYTDYQYEDPSNGFYHNEWDWEADAAAAPVKVEPTEEEFQFGKIILGSKQPTEPTEREPDVQPEETEDIRQENYNYNMSLVLEDWGPFLHTSKCYCHECQILFATLNTHDAHKMVSHSLLVATDKEPSPDRNRAVKSTARVHESPTANLLHSRTCEICKTYFKGHSGKSNLNRHYRNVHQVDPFSKTLQELRDWKICNHCNVYFPNDTALVTHLYELLPLNENKGTDGRNTPVKAQIAVKSTTSLNDKSKKTSPVKKEKNSTPSPNIVATGSTVTPVKVKDVKATSSVVKYDNRFILGSKVTVKSEDGEQICTKPSVVRKCEVCGGEYSRKYYYQHMRRIHPEFLTLRLGKLKKLHTPVNANTNIRYKCNVCKLVLNSYPCARDHRLKKHPQTSGQKIFKIIKTNKIQKIKAIVKKEVQPEEETNIVVPKSTLFKCSMCSVHFMTCNGACAHSRVCESTSNIRDWGCPQCHKVFKNTDKKAHEFQHEASSSKFKVFVVYLEMVVRILCECPYCYVCFEETKFQRHIHLGCDRDAESFYCNECRLPVDVSSKSNHESKHNLGDFTKDDFIKVDYVASQREIDKDVKKEVRTESVSPKKATPVRNLKRKMEEPETEAKKRKYPAEVTNLFYCPTCKCSLTRKIPYHVQKKCKGLLTKKITLNNRIKVPPRPACKHCGLCFTSNTYGQHKKVHEKYPKLTLLDLTLTRLTDDKKIKPVPENYTCKKCNVTFITKKSRHFHTCGKAKSIECQECEKKIEKPWFKTHMNFHNYVIPGKMKSVVQKKKLLDVAASSKSPMTQNLPELLMKYKSLTTLWNILYLCEVCDTFTDSYDKVVEHSQNHFSNMESYGVVIMKCQICNMKFDRDCYRRHLELHAGSKVITKKSFKILKYDHAKLYSPDWLNFLDLPEDQKSQLLTRSIYGETRSIRLSLVQQGPPEYTVYKCLQCLNCVPPHTLTYHVNLQKCTKAHKIRCRFCDLAFVSKAVCDKHEELHDKKDLKTDSFRIIAFNNSKSGETLDKQTPDKEVETKSNNSSNVLSNQPARTGNNSKYDANIKTIKGKKFFMFYKCGDCSCCTLFESNSRKHVCNNMKKNKTCFKCGLDFSLSYIHIHHKLHDKFDISKQNVFTKTFHNHNKSDVLNDKIPAASTNAKIPNGNKKDDAKLYKCHCGLHYTSLKSIEKHYRAKNCSTVARERCSQCKLFFDPLEVVNHLCKHHAQAQFKNFDIIIPTKKTLYKCNQCHILFYDKRMAGSHNNICRGKASGTKCEQCGLAFHGTSIETHREDHKACGVLRPDCYIVVNMPANNRTAVLYRCKICDVHFMMKSTLKDHILVHNHKISFVKECNDCGLKFSTKTLMRHVEHQHRIQKIEDFDIRHLSDEDLNTSKNTTTEGDSSEEVDVVSQLEPKVKTVVCQVFKCKKCTLHFTDRNTLTKHYEDRCSKELSDTCEDCDKKFASKNFKEHVKQHCDDKALDIRVIEHDEVTVEDTSVTKEEPEPETSTYKIFKCKSCDLHFNTKKTLTIHVSVNCRSIQYPVKCKECDRTFSKHSLMKHKFLDHKRSHFEIVTLTDSEIKRINLSVKDIKPQKASVVKRKAKYLQDNAMDETQNQASNDDTVASLNSSFELESTDAQDKTKIASEDSTEKKNTAKVKLYKCGDCNVYFLTQASCYKHALKHRVMDPKDYIECKLCGFQFTIMALPTHIKKHHASDLNLEDVLVEEYQPNNLKNNVPKIEIYYAIDKYQSRLVSTTSEVKNNTSEVLDGLDESNAEDSEVTSNCNELTDKIDDDQQVVYAVIEDENDDVEKNDGLNDACSELDSSNVNNKVENETDKQELHIPQD